MRMVIDSGHNLIKSQNNEEELLEALQSDNMFWRTSGLQTYDRWRNKKYP